MKHLRILFLIMISYNLYSAEIPKIDPFTLANELYGASNWTEAYIKYNAIHNENATIPGGTVNMDGVRRSISVTGEFKDPTLIGNIVITSTEGKPFYLKDVAEAANNIDSTLFRPPYGKITLFQS